MSMNKQIWFASGAIALLALPSTAFAADATATAGVNATVLTPIAISKTTDLNFGSFAADASETGTVVLATGGTRSFTGGTSAVSTGAGTVTAASFTVTGEGAATFSITLPSSAVTLTRAAGMETMSVDAFVSDPSGTGTLENGTKIVNVGATLNVGAAQVAGSYENAAGLPVTVAYN